MKIPEIENYTFGRMEINGNYFDDDIELRWTGEVLKWWREESHMVYIEDIKRGFEKDPELIIIGTGASGMMNVSEAVQDEISKRGMKLIIDETEEAAKAFNSLLLKGREKKDIPKKVIALFHLTC